MRIKMGSIRIHDFKNAGSKTRLGILLFLNKILYMSAVTLMLPEKFNLWDFEKNIDWFFLPLELFFFFVTLFLVLTVYRHGNPFCFFEIVVFTLFFIPANSSLSMSGVEFEYYFAINLYSIALFLAYSILLVRKIEVPDTQSVGLQNTVSIWDNVFENKRQEWVIRILMLIICSLSIGRAYMYNGLDFNILFSDMYTTRGEYADYIAENQGTLMSYVILIISGSASWFLPVLLHYFLRKKRILDSIFVLFTFLCVFLTEMIKAQLFVILIVLFVAWLEKNNKVDYICEVFLKGVVLLITAEIIVFLIWGHTVTFDLFVKRIMYIPNYLNHIFYSFYSKNPKIYFTHDALVIQNIMSKFLTNNYIGSAFAVISENCFGGWMTSPNTGFFAEAYAQLGLVGIVVYPFIHVIIAKIIYQYSSFYGCGAIYIALFFLGWRLLSVFVLQSSCMVGILMFILITWFIQHLKYKKND